MKTGNDTFLPVGTIIKSHGLKGEVIVDPIVTYPEQVFNQPLFYIRNKRGDWMPVRVETGRLQQKGYRTSFFVKFVQITDRDEAEKIRGQQLCLPASVVEPLQVEVSGMVSCIGYQVLTSDGTDYGIVLDVIDNPAHPILEVTGDYGRFMIPMVDAYIVETDDEHHQIIGRNLEQLTRM